MKVNFLLCVNITTYILTTYKANNANNANNGFLGFPAENTKVRKTPQRGGIGKNVFCVIRCYSFHIKIV